MTTLKFLLVLTFPIFMFTAAKAQKTILNNSEIPVEIKNYVTQYFKEHKIKKATKEVGNNKTEYEINLNKKVELEFDEAFNIIEIEAKNGIPFQLLPKSITNYIRNEFPNSKIVEWKFKNGVQQIELINKTKIYFDAKGTFIKTESK